MKNDVKYYYYYIIIIIPIIHSMISFIYCCRTLFTASCISPDVCIPTIQLMIFLYLLLQNALYWFMYQRDNLGRQLRTTEKPKPPVPASTSRPFVTKSSKKIYRSYFYVQTGPRPTRVPLFWISGFEYLTNHDTNFALDYPWVENTSVWRVCWEERHRCMHNCTSILRDINNLSINKTQFATSCV